MANTRKANLNTGFDDQEYLYSIRQDLLNPLAVRAAENKAKIDEAYPLAKDAIARVEKNDAKKTLTFKKAGGGVVDTLDLSNMIPEVVIPDFTYPIQNKDGNTLKDIQMLKIGEGIEVAESHPNTGSGGTVTLTVPSPWAKIGAGNWNPVKNFTILDPNNKAKIDGNTLTIPIPKDYGQFQGQIAEGSDQPIKKIKVTGDLDKVNITDEVMTITLPSGSGGGTVTAEGYFRGFFETLGDVESKVTDPTPGKTLVFVKDHLYPGSKYYNSYFYTNSGWTEVPTDPAITYTPETSSSIQGVFSIKPDPRITIDAKGQLDLGGLATDEAKLNFHGFYDTQTELDTAVPRPILDKSFAYVKHENGAWIGKAYRQTQTGRAWQPMVPISGLSFVQSTTDLTNPGVIYGIAKNDDWEIGSNGILSLKEKEAEISVDLVAKDGTVTKNPVTTLKVEYGAPRVEIDAATKTATIKPIQKVIQYDPAFETSHSGIEWEGTIYYDETSRAWMGWGVPDAAGAVDKKWTRIAHRGMSDEVKDLSKRLPVKAPDVVAGVLGDDPKWQYSGWTYVAKDDTQLPEAFRSRCGAYISTIIQDVPNDTPRPQERLQICYADEQGGHCYVRRWWKGSDSGASDQGWKPWVKISMSAKDISDHNTDPGAHNSHHKFYKVGTLDVTWAELKNGNYKIKDSDLLLIADSHGISKDGEDGLVIPYTGQFRFSGRVEFDGWKSSSSPHPKPQFIMYVYKVTSTQETIIAEFGYTHADHTKPIPPLKWKSDGITLNYGDKVRFEFKDFGGALVNETDLFMIPSRTYFVVEDVNTTAGSRIATTHKRTVGAVNARSDVGVNVHRYSAGSSNIRVYGTVLPTTTANMNKVTKP